MIQLLIISSYPLYKEIKMRTKMKPLIPVLISPSLESQEHQIIGCAYENARHFFQQFPLGV